MKRAMVIVGGVACVGAVACIEERSATVEPEGEVDGSPQDGTLADAGPAVDDGLRPDVLVDPTPEDAALIEPIPRDAGSPPVDAALPQLPPWECPPEGRRVFGAGARIITTAGPLEAAAARARIVQAGPEVAQDIDALDDVAEARMGRPAELLQWFRAEAEDGGVWLVGLDLPVPVEWEVGALVSIQTELGVGFFSEGLGEGWLRIADERGLRAFLQAGGRWAEASPELGFSRGEQTCYWEEPEEYFCTYTGYRLRATADDAVRDLEYGQVAEVGPFTAFHAGLMSIGDRGACNAAPERALFGAWRP